MQHVRLQAYDRRGLAFVMGNFIASIGSVVDVFSILALTLINPSGLLVTLVLLGFSVMILGNALVFLTYMLSPKKEFMYRFLSFTLVLLILSVLAIHSYQFLDIIQVLAAPDENGTIIFFMPTPVYLTLLILMMLNAAAFYGLILRKRIKLQSKSITTSIFTDTFQLGEACIILTLLVFMVAVLLLGLANNVVVALFSLMGAAFFNGFYLIGAIRRPQYIFPEYKELETALEKGEIAYVMYYFGMMGPEPVLARLLKVTLNEKEIRKFLIDFGIKHMTGTGFGIEYEGGMISGRLVKPIYQDFLFISGWGKFTRENIDHRFGHRPYLGFCLFVNPEYQWILQQKEYWESFRLYFLERVVIDDVSFETVNEALKQLFLMITHQVSPKINNLEKTIPSEHIHVESRKQDYLR